MTKTNLQLSLGFSPCPNDTFIFYSLVNNLVKTDGLTYCEQLEDVETLNQLAIAGKLDVSKVSYHALGHIREQYALLRSGSALGRGCGPILIAREHYNINRLHEKIIAIPGKYTTANLLLQLFDPKLKNFVVMPFNQIMNAVNSGEVDAGLIIHESRFTYQKIGLKKLLDLGKWWEEETELPIPLGGIVAKRCLGASIIGIIERALHEGVEYSRNNPHAASQYIRQHSQEMSEAVCAAHIALYVNDFSSNLGEEGERAIESLMKRAELAGIIPTSKKSLFI